MLSKKKTIKNNFINYLNNYLYLYIYKETAEKSFVSLMYIKYKFKVVIILIYYLVISYIKPHYYFIN